MYGEYKHKGSSQSSGKGQVRGIRDLIEVCYRSFSIIQVFRTRESLLSFFNLKQESFRRFVDLASYVTQSSGPRK